MKKLALTFCLGSLFAAAVEAGPLHWVPVGPPGNPAITAVALSQVNHDLFLPPPPMALYVAASGGSVWKSFDSGRTWTSIGAGLPGPDIAALAARDIPLPVFGGVALFGTTIFAAVAGAGVYRFGGSFWEKVNGGLTSLQLAALAVDGNGSVYAGTAAGVFKSTDDGKTWVPKTVGLPQGSNAAITALAAGPSVPETLYAGTTVGLFRSTDGGETWSQLDPFPGFVFSVTSVAVDPLVPSRVYADGAKQPPCFPLCLPIAFLPEVVRSLDGGATWSPTNGIAFNLVRALVATSTLPSRIFAGTASRGVFESDDAGVTWTAANDGLGTASVSSLVIDPVLPSLIFAGTAQGVFCAPLGQVAVQCSSDGQTLCLNGRRFSARVAWRDPGGNTGSGRALPITDNSGAFWFFDPTNLELVVKVLDGRSVNGKFWVFYGALSNVEYTITVTDTLTSAVKTYINPQGQLASVADTSAF